MNCTLPTGSRADNSPRAAVVQWRQRYACAVALFGRWSARQRLRDAARESLNIPAFSAPVDCSSWVLGGLWPAELTTITPETAPLADYLNADLQRIAHSANEKLYAISQSDLAGPARQAAETRAINVARAFAVLRVESTVRQLHKEALDFGTEYTSLNAVPGPPTESPKQSSEAPPRRARHRLPESDAPAAPAVAPPAREPLESEQTPEPEVVTPAEPIGGLQVEPTGPVVADQPEPAPAKPTLAESDEQRLRRLLAFVARQEPGLRWAIGTFADGTTRLVTDIANGWIPSGIELPDGVQLLEPGRRSGTATEMLGEAKETASYSPGDRLGWASDFGATDTSAEPRRLAPVEDLAWRLSEATHWREGLPRMANTLVKAGAADTGVIDAEIDLLRVHLDTMRYQLLAQYPDSEAALVLNCMLLAATEGIATGDTVSANYHFSWFRTLSAPTAGQGD